MAESPEHTEEYKEPTNFNARPETNGDVEGRDHGILVKANPLSRELQGRHTQMIAIGMILVYFFAMLRYH